MRWLNKLINWLLSTGEVRGVKVKCDLCMTEFKTDARHAAWPDLCDKCARVVGRTQPPRPRQFT